MLPKIEKQRSFSQKIHELPKQKNDLMKKFLRFNHNESIPTFQVTNPKMNKPMRQITVFKVDLPDIEQKLAIKQTVLNQNEKEREIMILKQLVPHPNIINLQHFFITSRGNQRILNLLTEYMPMTLRQLINSYKQRNKLIPVLIVKLFTYQLLRGVSYLHLHNICHRNINPDNILIDNQTFQLKICDFSEAKLIQAGEHSISQVNTINYRAPELLLGATNYSLAIDLWALGCIISELAVLKPIFEGNTQEEVFAEIIKCLGTPSTSELINMGSPIEQINLPKVEGKIKNAENEISQFGLLLLKYSPLLRGNALDYLDHKFLKELRSGNLRLNGKEFPNIFNFNNIELREEGYRKLIPSWYQ